MKDHLSKERSNEESEEDEELYTSSLLNFADDLGIYTIGDSITRVLSSIDMRNGQLTDQMAQVRNSLTEVIQVVNFNYKIIISFVSK